MSECEKPEDVEGNNFYSFVVDGKSAFGYDDRGKTAFVSINEKWYEVKNPTIPPIDAGIGLSDIEKTDQTGAVADN